MSVINISGPTYTCPSLATNNQRALNLFPIAAGQEGKSEGYGKTTMIPRMGFIELADTGLQSVRALLAIENIVYGVADNKFFKCEVNTLLRTGELTLLGTINNFVGRVELAANATQILIVNGTELGYIYDTEDLTFNEISDPAFLGGLTATFMDGYLIYTPPDTQQIYSSDLNDGTSWDALDVVSAEYKNDKTVKLITKRRELWVLGTDSVEVFYDAANVSGSPFSPRIGSEIGIGCRSGASVVALNNTLIWLDSRGFVVTAIDSNSLTNTTSGHEAAILSTDPIHTAIASYQDTENAIGIGFHERGHLMYQITFPLDKKTWVYDLQTEQWHERSFFNSGRGEHETHLAHYCVQMGEIHIIAGPRDGLLYIMHQDYHDDAGNAIRAVRHTQPYTQDFKLMGVDQLELRCNSGYATSTGLGSNPKITMRYSNDNGRTWSNELIGDLGDIGEYNKRISWNRLGSGVEWMFEFTVTEPIDYALVSASINISEIEQY